MKAFELYGDVELRTAKLKSGMQSANKEFSDFEMKAKGHLRNVENSFSKFGSNFGKGFLSSFNIQQGGGFGALLGSGAGNLLQGGAKALFGHVTDAMERGMQFADQVQKWKFGFTNLMGSEAEALKHLRDLITFGKESAFETEDVVNYAVKLEAVGVKAKEVKDILLGLGNAAAAAGNFDKMGQANLAVYQMLSKNKVGAEEMTQQLAEVIPDPYGYMARGMGMDRTQVMKLGEEGRLNAQSAVRIMLAQMLKERGGILEQVVGGTLSGQTARLEDTKSILFAQSMLGGDLLGTPGGAYAQRMANIKTQTNLYGGPESATIGKHLGSTAETYYGVVGGLEERMFQSDWFTDLLHGDPSGANKKLETLGSFVPEGLRNGILSGVKMVSDAANSTLGINIWKTLEDFWETNSPSKKTIRMGEWIIEGFEIGLSKTQRGNLSRLTTLAGQSPDFLKKMGEGAAKLGINPADLLNVFAVESGFNPAAFNKYGYAGLMQIGSREAKAMGTSSKAIAGMSPEEQLPYIFQYLESRLPKGGGPVDLATLYATVGHGSASSDPNKVFWKKGQKGYTNNPLWDVNKDGLIQQWEFGHSAMSALGATGMSRGGAGAISPSNPVPVAIVGSGDGLEWRKFKASPYGGSDIQGAAASIFGAPPKTARTIDGGSLFAGNIYGQEQPLKTSMLYLTEGALMLKKPLDLLVDTTTAAANGMGGVKEKIEAEFGAAIIAAPAGKKKRNKLTDAAFTGEGIAGDFQGGLQSLLSGLGHEKPTSLLKQFGLGMLQDIQGRLSHDFSAMITGALFGGRDSQTNQLTGGGLFSKIFGSFFGGGRASGGSMSAGRFYLAGEHGPELVSGPGFVHNAEHTRAMMGGPQRSEIVIAIGDEAVGRTVDRWQSHPRGMKSRFLRAKYGRMLSVGYS